MHCIVIAMSRGSCVDARPSYRAECERSVAAKRRNNEHGTRTETTSYMSSMQGEATDKW